MLAQEEPATNVTNTRFFCNQIGRVRHIALQTCFTTMSRKILIAVDNTEVSPESRLLEANPCPF